MNWEDFYKKDNKKQNNVRITDIEELDNVNTRVKKMNIYGLDDEVEELIKGLMRLKKANVLIIGKAGIGKTSLVEKLAQKINNYDVPVNLRNKKIYELSLNTTVAGTKYRGEFEEKVQKILDFIASKKNIILFVDEIHNLLKLGGAEGSMALGETLKPYLARNKITLIGATTEEEYRKYLKRDTAFDRRFYKLKMKEPRLKEVYEMLKINKQDYEKYYNIRLNEEDFKTVILRSLKRKGQYPDKAFDELEEYCYELRKGVNI